MCVFSCHTFSTSAELYIINAAMSLLFVCCFTVNLTAVLNEQGPVLLSAQYLFSSHVTIMFYHNPLTFGEILVVTRLRIYATVSQKNFFALNCSFRFFVLCKRRSFFKNVNIFSFNCNFPPLKITKYAFSLRQAKCIFSVALMLRLCIDKSLAVACILYCQKMTTTKV